MRDEEIVKKHFEYLNELRESGVTNMFGASPFLKKAFPKDFKSIDEASARVSEWMKQF